MAKEILLREEFDNSQGRFPGYDTYVPSERGEILEQGHVDIRNFAGKKTVPINMLHLSFLTMDQLAALDMDDLTNGVTIVKPEEPWTVGTLAEDAARLHWRGISVTCTAGTTTTSSVIIE